MRRIAVVLLSCCIVGQAPARTLTVFGSLYAEHQSNIIASTLNPRAGALGRARLEIGGEDMAEHYAWTLNGKFSYQAYEDQLFSNQFYGDAVGNLRWIVRPQSLDWHFDYIESVEVLDPGRIGQEDNQQSVRVFGTGPVYRQRFRQSNELVVSLRRQRVENEFQGYYRNIGTATLWRDIRDRHRTFIEANATRVEYGDDQPDFEIREATLGYLYEWPKASARFEAGRAWLDQELIGEQQTETGSIRLRWLLGGGRSVQARSEFRYGDEATNLQSVPDELLTGAVDSVGAFREEVHTLYYSGSEKVADPSASLWFRERRYQRQIFAERDTRETGITLSSRLYNGDAGFLLLRMTAGHRDFLFLDRLDRDYSGTISATRKINSRNELIVGFTRFERDSTVGLASFTNNTVFIEYRGRL